MKILKFGGVSLGSVKGVDSAVEIIRRESLKGDVAIVLSARGDTTDRLVDLLDRVVDGSNYCDQLEDIVNRINNLPVKVDLRDEFETLISICKGVKLLGEYSDRVKAKFLSYGEILTVKVISRYLAEHGITNREVYGNELFTTKGSYLKSDIDREVSKAKVDIFTQSNSDGVIPIVTGFFGENLDGEISLLGRNGSNYTATSLADLLKAEEVEIWTHVDGIYTVDPTVVTNPNLIEKLSYNEAVELASFGATILHTRSILPLIDQRIPLTIKNIFNHSSEGTKISGENGSNGIKALTLIEDVTLITVEGKTLYGKVGIDGRIFSALSKSDISVRMISQASSERSIGFIVDDDDGAKAINLLCREFSVEVESGEITFISKDSDVAVLSAIGNCLKELPGIAKGLNKNGIKPLLFANSVNNRQLSLVVKNKLKRKAAKVIHSRIFGAVKELNVAIFGVGSVGGAFVDQLIKNREGVKNRLNLAINIVAISNSKKTVYYSDQKIKDWREELANSTTDQSIENLLGYVKQYTPENLVFIDATSSKSLTDHYLKIVDGGFDIIAANKIGNTLDYSFYKGLRDRLNRRNKQFYYETNVGAALPLIDTIKGIYSTGDRIKTIRGVFSGSLSYIFNKFSSEECDISSIIKDAVDGALTEPDPRDDLKGTDVARKLLILAREIGYSGELTDIEVENLIPKSLQGIDSLPNFYEKFSVLDSEYRERKLRSKGKLLRYVGELNDSGKLSVKLTDVDPDSALGRLRGADSLFEIFTERYRENPIIIQGAGAGAEVTASGLFSDLLRVGEIASRS